MNRTLWNCIKSQTWEPPRHEAGMLIINHLTMMFRDLIAMLWNFMRFKLGNVNMK